MEVLQVAVEDNLYFSAINETHPQPTKRWDWPGMEEITSFMAERVANEPTMLEPETVCSNPLGFYLVTDP